MTRWVRLAVVVALGLASACSNDSDAIPAGASTTRSSASATTADRDTSTTTSTAVTAEAEIIARYEAFWDARFAANQPPANPDHPGLREYAIGAQLEEVLAETKGNQEDGVAFRRPPNSVYARRVKLISIDGDTARLYDCVTNDGIVYRVESDDIIDDAVATKSLEVVMRLVDGNWKLERTTLLQRWDGVSGCALADS